MANHYTNPSRYQRSLFGSGHLPGAGNGFTNSEPMTDLDKVLTNDGSFNGDSRLWMPYIPGKGEPVALIEEKRVGDQHRQPSHNALVKLAQRSDLPFLLLRWLDQDTLVVTPLNELAIARVPKDLAYQPIDLRTYRRIELALRKAAEE